MYDDNIWRTKTRINNELSFSCFCVSGSWGMYEREYWSFKVFFFYYYSFPQKRLCSYYKIPGSHSVSNSFLRIALISHLRSAHFHVFLLSVTCFAFSKRNTAACLYLFDVLILLHGLIGRKRQKKQNKKEEEIRELCQIDIWETGIFSFSTKPWRKCQVRLL